MSSSTSRGWVGAWTSSCSSGRYSLSWNSRYLLNAYRVLLTRARQGMAIFVPPGDPDDPTRLPEFYDATFGYLTDLGLPTLG
ncbi:MAG: DUF2075 domain-containing protein [Verrucomicrobiales bacterium]|nr:DUF2075 domain-containing protein [Verrucomicrobiales bacterium]